MSSKDLKVNENTLNSGQYQKKEKKDEFSKDFKVAKIFLFETGTYSLELQDHLKLLVILSSQPSLCRNYTHDHPSTPPFPIDF